MRIYAQNLSLNDSEKRKYLEYFLVWKIFTFIDANEIIHQKTINIRNS